MKDVTHYLANCMSDFCDESDGHHIDTFSVVKCKRKFELKRGESFTLCHRGKDSPFLNYSVSWGNQNSVQVELKSRNPSIKSLGYMCRFSTGHRVGGNNTWAIDLLSSLN